MTAASYRRGTSHENTAGTERQDLALTAVIALTVYFLGLRGLLGSALLIVLFTLLALIFARERAAWLQKLRGQMIFLLAALVMLTVIVAASQWIAYTPPILGEDGRPLPGRIASLEKVRLGGVDQRLIIRGLDVNKPVLLFLSGGPWGSTAFLLPLTQGVLYSWLAIGLIGGWADGRTQSIWPSLASATIYNLVMCILTI